MFEVNQKQMYLKVFGRRVKVSNSPQTVMYLATILAVAFSKEQDDSKA